MSCKYCQSDREYRIPRKLPVVYRSNHMLWPKDVHVSYCPFCGRRLDGKDELELLIEERKRNPRKPMTEEERTEFSKLREKVGKIFEEREKEERERRIREFAELLGKWWR